MAMGSFDPQRRQGPMSDINVVPLVDVMLVLLVIFIITAPLLTNAVKIDLPKASSSPTSPGLSILNSASAKTAICSGTARR